MRRAWIITLLLATLVAATGAVEPRASLPDIEDEVMCVQCKTPLNLSTAAVAEREREFIRREIARGKTKDEIKAGLVERFGPAVLAMPEDEGFGLAAYMVPVLAGLLALAAVMLWLRRWRGPSASTGRTKAPGAADSRRLERELAAHDRRP
jgi:cytochrome c-type biogenesis protein CcmH/NrfF